ncbi:MAG: pirin family protein [Alcaligenaceae bacterium]|nr:pirin family protein [Alcaligenaceae bacterium]HZJ98282.1 pirin family protein [Oligella sp.]
MLEIRKSDERGVGEHGWLNSRHSFSFANYYDPEHMGFGPLRVINEDRVKAGYGFGEHSHNNMEIISYVLDGALEHKDSMGNGSIIHYGDVQRMSAGTGVRHSEFNPSQTEDVHFLQIWIMPKKNGITPSYEEKHFDAESKKGKWRLIASPDGSEGSVVVHQDALIFASILSEDDTLEYYLEELRYGYLHVARGSVTVNGLELNAGDAIKVYKEPKIVVTTEDEAEILWFDMTL